jgi:hypothetical protein
LLGEETENMDTPAPQKQDVAERPAQNNASAEISAPLVNWNAETNQSFRDAQARSAAGDSTNNTQPQQIAEVERTRYHDNLGGVIAGTILGTVASELLYGRRYYPVPPCGPCYPSPYPSPYDYPPPVYRVPPPYYPSPYDYPPPVYRYPVPPVYRHPVPMPPPYHYPGGHHRR